MAEARRKARTSHISIYEQFLKIPEYASIIRVTEREIGNLRRQLERENKDMKTEIELEQMLIRQKIKKMFR